MKKITIIIVLIVIALCMITYVFMQYKINYQNIKTQNLEFEKYLDKEITYSELTTAINRAVDKNFRNDVEEDSQGFFKENDTNSIKIKIMMTDNDKTYEMESIYNGGMENFLYYYRQIKFKCTKIEYHQKTKLISKVYFEQVM